MDIFFTAIFFIGGLLFGSFLNVVLLRYGYHESSRARSGCMHCEKPLTWYEFLPLVSYLVLRGRCRGCGSRISLQYPLVELLLGVLWAATFVYAPPSLVLGAVMSFVGLLAFWWFFVALVVYDIQHTLVPTVFAWGLIASAALVRVGEVVLLPSAAPLVDALMGAGLLGGFLLLIVLFTKGRGMGVGDIYVAVALGILFGVTRGIDVLVVSFWVGAIIGVLGIVLSSLYKTLIQKKTGAWFTMRSEVPFVPFLFLASVIGAFSDVSPFTLIHDLMLML